ncbi:helix-turn-helix domain-containing protein [Carboxylicivirga caseinilyticus]|uniref:helix-turn-helix domain-containing protein n=1 Tax=Carboxylicivirga caseinilyticus TaxID=3417572 RepID=UPI003D333919|nr:helix-turn-helix domain-containing protein [Marinilabiliaceae bacterium A049]
METGKLIKELRLQKGMTQEELAEKTELSSRTIQRIESGEVDPRAYTLQMIAKALEVDFSLFIKKEADETDFTGEPTQNNWLALLHLSGLIPLILPTVLIWRLKKDKTKAMLLHFRAVISFQLIIWAICLACIWIYWKVDQPIPLMGTLFASALVSIINSIQVLFGKSFIHPFLKRY